MVTYSLISVLCFCLVASLCFWCFRCFLVLLEHFAVFVRVKSFCKKKNKEFTTALITLFTLLLYTPIAKILSKMIMLKPEMTLFPKNKIKNKGFNNVSIV